MKRHNQGIFLFLFAPCAILKHVPPVPVWFMRIPWCWRNHYNTISLLYLYTWHQSRCTRCHNKIPEIAHSPWPCTILLLFSLVKIKPASVTRFDTYWLLIFHKKDADFCHWSAYRENTERHSWRRVPEIFWSWFQKVIKCKKYISWNPRKYLKSHWYLGW